MVIQTLVVRCITFWIVATTSLAHLDKEAEGWKMVLSGYEKGENSTEWGLRALRGYFLYIALSINLCTLDQLTMNNPSFHFICQTTL
jgi:hypothetical protein